MWKSAENMWLTQITKTTCVYGNLDVKEWLTHFTETNPYKERMGGDLILKIAFLNNM